MDFNLVGLVKDYFNKSLVIKISRTIESDNGLTQSALDVAIPSLLGHLHTQSSQPHNQPHRADSIFKLVSNQNGGILKSFTEILSTNNHVQLASTGNNILTTTFGKIEQDTMVENIANHSGLSDDAASTLLGLMTPATLSLVKLKLLDSGEFNSTNLTSMLDLQQDNIKSAMPDELSMLDTHGNANEDENQIIDNPIKKDTNGNTNAVNKETAPIMTNKPHHQPQNASQQHVESNQPLQNKKTVNSSFWLTKILPLLLFTGVLYLAFSIMVKSDRQSESNEPTADAKSTSLTRIQKPLSRNRSSSYQTNINQHMQPISKPATPETTAGAEQNNLESNAQIEIAQNLQSELDNSLSQVANTLGKIVDIPSAKLAADDIRKVTIRIDELTEISKTMPVSVKDRLSELITTNLPRLQTLTKNANDISGVGAVIKSPIQDLAASLTNLL